MTVPSSAPPVGLGEVAVQWGRIGCTGFGGPPAHVALLRDLCVVRRRWLDDEHFEDALAACNVLPGPASTQLAILCAWTVAGPLGGIVGGVAFILPGLVAILGLAALFLAASPPLWVLGAGAGAGSAVAAVAVHSGLHLAPGSWARALSRPRWLGYAVLGALAAAFTGPWIVVVLVGCGVCELALRRSPRPTGGTGFQAWPLVAATAPTVAVGGLVALAWVALKVGGFSYGGGFVIIPLMRHDAVQAYHWMTDAQFLDAVALGQVTPGPVTLTVAAVGYAAAGVGGGLLAALVAFTPSFLFVLIGGRHFDALRRNSSAQGFLGGAGPAAIGAIVGVALPLARALDHAWQFAVLGGALIVLFGARRRTVVTLVLAAVAGVIAVELGAPIG